MDELVVTGNYTGYYEIINTTKIFNCNIVIYRKAKFNYTYKKFNLEFETIVNKNDTFLNPFSPIIIIACLNNNLFVLLIPANNKINFNTKKKKSIIIKIKIN